MNVRFSLFYILLFSINVSLFGSQPHALISDWTQASYGNFVDSRQKPPLPIYVKIKFDQKVSDEFANIFFTYLLNITDPSVTVNNYKSRSHRLGGFVLTIPSSITKENFQNIVNHTNKYFDPEFKTPQEIAAIEKEEAIKKEKLIKKNEERILKQRLEEARLKQKREEIEREEKIREELAYHSVKKQLSEHLAGLESYLVTDEYIIRYLKDIGTPVAFKLLENLKRYKQYWIEGNQFLNENKSHEAIRCFDAAIAIDPENSNLWALRAVANLNLQQCHQSLSDYTQAIRFLPECGRHYTGRAVVYGKMGNTSSMLIDLKKATALGDQEAKNILSNLEAKVEADKKMLAEAARQEAEAKKRLGISEAEIQQLSWGLACIKERFTSMGDNALSSVSLKSEMERYLNSIGTPSAMYMLQKIRNGSYY